MKKVLIGLIAVLALCGQTYASMEAMEFEKAVVGVTTQAVTKTIRGELQGVYITCPSGATGTVVITSAEQTLFTKASIVASAFFNVIVPSHTSAGVAIVNLQSTGTNVVYTKTVMAGEVTATFTGQGGSSLTNTWKATVLFKP